MTPSDLLQVFAELVAVFLGVSLSFRVADRKERRSEERTARQTLEGIRNDLAAELPTVEWLIGIYQPTAAAGEQLYETWRTIPAAIDRTEAVLRALHAGAPFSPARSHYETAKSAGHLGLVADRELRTSIAAVFEQQHAYLRGISQISVDSDFEFFRGLRAYIEYGESDETFGIQIVPVESTLAGRISLLPGAAEKLSRDDVVRNSLYMMVLFRRFFAEVLQGYAETLRKLDAALSRAVSDEPHRRAV